MTTFTHKGIEIEVVATGKFRFQLPGTRTYRFVGSLLAAKKIIDEQVGDVIAPFEALDVGAAYGTFSRVSIVGRDERRNMWLGAAGIYGPTAYYVVFKAEIEAEVQVMCEAIKELRKSLEAKQAELNRLLSANRVAKPGV